MWLVRGISSILLIPIGGVMADKFNRKHLILLTDLVSSIVSFSFIFVSNGNYHWLLPVLVFTAQAINRIFDPAAKASFKEVSIKTPLEISGSFSAILGQIAMISGPLLASLILLVSNNIYVLFVLDGATFLLSFFIMFFVFFGHFEKKRSEKNSFYHDIKEGFIFVLSNKKLFLLIISMIPIAFSGKVFEELILSLSEQKWGFGEVGGIGIYLTIFAVGGILGSAQVKRWKDKMDKVSLYYTFTFSLGILFILLGSIYNLISSLITTLVIGVFLNMSVVMAQINIQKTVENNFLGRVFSVWTFLAVLGGGIGASISGFLADLFSVNISLIIMGILIITPFSFLLLSKGLGKKDPHYSKKPENSKNESF